MRETKRCIQQFAFYDKAGIQEYLEKQAEKGWMLQKMSLGWVFRRIEPKKVRFFVTYYPKKSVFEAEGSEEQRLFWDFCEHAGWKLAATNEQMQIFYNEREDPVPIETDAVMEVEKVHQSTKKSYVLTYVLLSENSMLFLFLAGVLLAAYIVREIVRYFLWYKKARRTAAEEGIFVPAKSIGRIWSLVPYFAILFILLEIIFLGSGRRALVFFHILLMMGLFTALIVGASGWMKRKGVSAAVNRLTVILLAAALCAVMVWGIFAMVIKGEFSRDSAAETYEYNGWSYEVRHDELPLTVGNLLQEEYDRVSGEQYSCELTEKESLLLSRIEAVQEPRLDAGNLPGMRYAVTRVRLPFLYDWCLQAVKDSYSRSQEYNGETAYRELREADAAPWGADAAYRLYRDDEAEREYVVCYGNVIAAINTSWELTEEQMAAAGEKLGEMHGGW